MACILLWSSAVKVHDSQACKKMDVTRERISRILELREILLSFQTGFNLVNAADACATPESISSLEPSSVITEPRYLKLVPVSHRVCLQPVNSQSVCGCDWFKELTGRPSTSFCTPLASSQAAQGAADSLLPFDLSAHLIG